MVDTNQFELLNVMLQVIGISVESIDQLYGQTIDRDILLQLETIEQFTNFIPTLKNTFHSSMLNCLHKNSLQKHRFPAINLLRQVCKTNNILLTPKVISMGYEKSTGKKLVKRLFVFEPDSS